MLARVGEFDDELSGHALPFFCHCSTIVDMTFHVGMGQDSHRFSMRGGVCIVAGLPFEDAPCMEADSDGDVVFHALCNAISSLAHVPILGDVAPRLCYERGIKDSRIYLSRALETLGAKQLVHIALTIEGKRPRFQARSREIRQSVADATELLLDQVGITFTSGDGLTAYGRGEGLMCLALITTRQ